MRTNTQSSNQQNKNTQKSNDENTKLNTQNDKMRKDESSIGNENARAKVSTEAARAVESSGTLVVPHEVTPTTSYLNKNPNKQSVSSAPFTQVNTPKH
jgi:hypothetical protein